MSKLIIANWKSNKTPALATEWCQQFSVKIPAETTVVVAPAFSLLPLIAGILPVDIKLGAQDVSSFPMGSYTGAVNAQQLKAAGISHVIVGHSERRRYFHETHQEVAAKVLQVVNNSMVPVLCMDDEYLEAQASALETKDIPQLVVAYEPVEAIGSGKNVSVDEVVRVSEKIKRIFGDVPVIYGGSVDERSVREYLLVCDGVLVGTASLEADHFGKLIAASV